jgi:hypothetical protein
VRAGLSVLKAIEELNQPHGLDLSARAAVNTADAVVGVDIDTPGEALAIGDVVDNLWRTQDSGCPRSSQ